MFARCPARSVAATALAAALMLVVHGASHGQEPPPPAQLTFHRDVVPILRDKCLRCHNPRKKDGALDVSTYAALLRGGNSGPPLVAGNSKRSLMIDMIFFDEMPPKNQRPRVSSAELKLLERWIDAGAPEGQPPEQ